jgi:hypothetical protein
MAGLAGLFGLSSFFNKKSFFKILGNEKDQKRANLYNKTDIWKRSYR